jgi:hypothetical protein
MTARDKIRSVEKDAHRLFLRRAEELLRAMKASEQAGDIIAAGVNGVQCAIALVDAVTAWHLGTVSAGQSHDEAATLLKKSGAKGAADRVGPFMRVLELKYLLEYDDRAPTEKEVADLVERVVRLHQWVVGVLPDSASLRGDRQK